MRGRCAGTGGPDSVAAVTSRVETLERRMLLSVVPLEPEALINTDTLDNQFAPSVAADDAGNYVIAWSSRRRVSPDNFLYAYDVYARRYSADGTPRGDAFVVNTSDGGQPSVAMDADGDFVIAWGVSNSSPAQARARRFDAGGTPRGKDFLLPDIFGDTVVGMDAAGNFVVAGNWSVDQPTNDIRAERFAADGTPLGTVVVGNNTSHAGRQYAAALAMNRDGDFVVSWRESPGPRLYAQSFSADGTPRGPEVVVPRDTMSSAVGIDANDNFAVCWETSSTVNARRFGPDGQPIGQDVVVSTAGAVQGVTMDVAPGGDFVLAWSEVVHNRAIYLFGRRYTAAGEPDGPAFRVHESTFDGAREAPSVETGAGGGMVIAWSSWVLDTPQVDLDKIDMDVYARRFRVDGPPRAATVAGRQVFYNRSAFDGNDPAANAADDGAIPADKQVLLPGGAASFANVTSYTRGINGVMVDVEGLPTGDLSGTSPAWVSVKLGTGGDPSAWSGGPRPNVAAVRRGAGVNGSDRVTLIWNDLVIRNTWMQVTIQATPETGLAAPDVFYVGNLVGETGDAATAPFRVNALDLSAVKRGLNTDAPITGRLDFDRNGRVNALDLAATRSLLNRGLTAPVLALPPAAGIQSVPPPGWLSDDDAEPSVRCPTAEILG